MNNPKSSTPRLWRIVLILLGALQLTLLASCSRKTNGETSADPSQAVSVGVVKVTRQDLSRDLDIAAEFRPFQEIEVYSKVAGYVKKIYVDYGDRVKQGQILAVLEVPELNDELVRSAAASRQAGEEVSGAQNELQSSESVHSVAHLQYTRLAEVMKSRPGLIAQQDLDNALGKDQEAEAKVAAAKSALAAARQQLQVAEANEQKVRTLLAYAQITAPFSGVITKRYADTGAMIQQGTASHTQAMPLVRLAENKVLRLVIPIPESVVPQVKLGAAVEVKVPALNRTFTGHVARFSDQLDLQTRTMHTEVDVPNPDLVLVPGMYAYAHLALAEKPHVLAVPLQALNRQGDKSAIYIVNGENKIEERAVRLGLEGAETAEVVSGVLENDEVIVSDRSELKPGQTVRPKIVQMAGGKGGL